jgi:predicted transcriptional regulator
VDVPESALALLREELAKDCVLCVRWEVPADAEHAGGLSVYGEQLGAYPVLPTVRLAVEGGHGLGGQFASDVPVAADRLLAGKAVLIATADKGGCTWRYTTAKPADNWAKPEFSDLWWKKGKAGFGKQGTPNLTVGTPWTTSDIWLRAEVRIDDPKVIRGGQWRIAHDEDVEVYLNGTRIAENEDGFLPFEVEITNTAERDGPNEIIVGVVTGFIFLLFEGVSFAELRREERPQFHVRHQTEL